MVFLIDFRIVHSLIKYGNEFIIKKKYKRKMLNIKY